MTKCYNVYLLQISRVMFVVLWFYYITIIFVFNFFMYGWPFDAILLFLLYWIYYNLENFLSNEFSFLYILILYILLFRYSLSCISPTIDIIYCQSPVVVLFFFFIVFDVLLYVKDETLTKYLQATFLQLTLFDNIYMSVRERERDP